MKLDFLRCLSKEIGLFRQVELPIIPIFSIGYVHFGCLKKKLPVQLELFTKKGGFYSILKYC